MSLAAADAALEMVLQWLIGLQSLNHPMMCY